MPACHNKQKTMNNQQLNFSKHLFWDVDEKSIDVERNDVFLIGRVIQYGYFSDWKKLIQLYGYSRIKEKVVQLRSLDDISLHFVSNLFKIPLAKFRCYTQKQSEQNYWKF